MAGWRASGAQVGLSRARARWPHQFSGGQRQRIAIARALACSPRSSSATRRSRHWTSRSRRRSSSCWPSSRPTGLSYIFITHDLPVVRNIADRIVVMQRGKIVEAGREEIFLQPAAPLHAGSPSREPGLRPRRAGAASAEEEARGALRPDQSQRISITPAKRQPTPRTRKALSSRTGTPRMCRSGR